MQPKPLRETVTRIAVPGGRGMLGTDLCELLTSLGYDVDARDLPEFDLRDDAQVAALLDDADAVVNCAAYTNVDGAEADADTALAVKATAVGDLGRLAAERGLHVLHVSTDFVFDGAKGRPYREDDTPRPLNVYGQTKLAGEEALAASGAHHATLRVQWTYGVHGDHFAGKVCRRAAIQQELMMVDDQRGAPTWTAEIADVLVAMLNRRSRGLFHFAAQGSGTRLDYARHVLDGTGYADRGLTPCRSDRFPTAAERPLYSVFDCTRIDLELGLVRRPWRTALTDFLEHWTPSTEAPEPGLGDA